MRPSGLLCRVAGRLTILSLRYAGLSSSERPAGRTSQPCGTTMHDSADMFAALRRHAMHCLARLLRMISKPYVHSEACELQCRVQQLHPAACSARSKRHPATSRLLHYIRSGRQQAPAQQCLPLTPPALPALFHLTSSPCPTAKLNACQSLYLYPCSNVCTSHSYTFQR